MHSTHADILTLTDHELEIDATVARDNFAISADSDAAGDCPAVIHISLPWMIDVVAALDRLEELLPSTPFNDAYYDLLDVQSRLEELFNQSVYRPYLLSSWDKADALHKAISVTMRALDNDDRNLAKLGLHAYGIRHTRDQFKLVFLSEASTLPVFLVTPKESYDVTRLISWGVGLFPQALLAKAPETKSDAQEVGRALAFEMPTACGFHTFRVTESVLKRYWDEASGGEARPHPQTIGKIASDMEKKKFGDTKIVESLKQLAKLHRNPIIHPDVILSVEEAIEIVGIARSVIGAMLRALPDVKVGAVSPPPNP